jgi:hypothetical protein
MIHGIEFLQGLFMPREWHVGLFARNLDYRYTKILVLIGLSVIGTFLIYPSKSIILLALYFIISAAWGAFISGASGIDWNSMFDLIISLTLIIGLLLNHLSECAQKNIANANRLYASIFLILFFSLILHAPIRFKETTLTLRNIHHARRVVADDIDFLASVKGPAMCENLSLCYWAGKDFEFDFFNTGEKIRTGVIDKKMITKLFKLRYFSVIQVNTHTGLSGRLPKSINKEMLKYYEISRFSPRSGVFLMPKTH